ncbi:MAG: transcription elongation factor GreAB [Phycisphaerales bacterium JB064]
MASLILEPDRRERDITAAERTPIISRVDRDRLTPLLVGDATEARARLRKLLERARVVEPRAIPGDVVTMRSRVVLRGPVDDGPDEFCLRYPEDARDVDGDGDQDLETLLVTSPLGAAVLAARPGDVITYPGARSSRTTVLEAIVFQPERAGQWTL